VGAAVVLVRHTRPPIHCRSSALRHRRAAHMIEKKLLEVWKGRTYVDRLEAMSVIIAVTETGSFSAASRRLKTPVATVSRKVAELESRLKAQLFQRSSR
jgi:Bacterial regulatory helix-turn-helix protein, lysR family